MNDQSRCCDLSIVLWPFNHGATFRNITGLAQLCFHCLPLQLFPHHRFSDVASFAWQYLLHRWWNGLILLSSMFGWLPHDRLESQSDIWASGQFKKTRFGFFATLKKKYMTEPLTACSLLKDYFLPSRQTERCLTTTRGQTLLWYLITTPITVTPILGLT